MEYAFAYSFREHDYWLGIDPASGRHLLGIPVSNPMAEYIEFYWIRDGQYQSFLENQGLAIEFAEGCRRREHDDLLTRKPGKFRGTPR
jgi:hypothetical protein